ncbi:hypothetical protein EJB05_06458 [Eragrostis curvula]|uniref:Uncharacterized protein n=1 Tax=Eragrostis curvula TaxID=38414 RepID=A0A5J9WG04_9POAL|nr:hypothetical protein EJB05_06458 [Eragrostis curvula]
MGGVDLSCAERLICKQLFPCMKEYGLLLQSDGDACMYGEYYPELILAKTSNDQNSIIIKARASSTSLEARVSLKARVPPNHPALRGGGRATKSFS